MAILAAVLSFVAIVLSIRALQENRENARAVSAKMLALNAKIDAPNGSEALLSERFATMQATLDAIKQQAGEAYSTANVARDTANKAVKKAR
jgi:hypothetical protein